MDDGLELELHASDTEMASIMDEHPAEPAAATAAEDQPQPLALTRAASTPNIVKKGASRN